MAQVDVRAAPEQGDISIPLYILDEWCEKARGTVKKTRNERGTR